MRHGKKFNHLGRTASHRKAMLSNMAASLIQHKRINTTLAKAKELKKYVEPLVTRSKSDSTHNRRMVFSYLQSKEAVTELFREVSVKVGDRPGGYTRIIKTGHRLGDNAEMAMIELVDFNEIYSNAKKEVKKSTRRGRSKATEEEVSKAPVAAIAAVAPVAPEAPEAPDAPEASEAPESPEADENNEEKEAE
ncbi:MAG: 50S ribosomal protein L17 [Flavobacteriaceae bacterium]|nr:50S ribosomal protein L17 [Flavobacteriaceae bacterium]PHX83643.1 MAG: 50S ribosomal protein L17 [Flavobacteriales bacterium]